MRTTIDLDADALIGARHGAQRERVSLGDVTLRDGDSVVVTFDEAVALSSVRRATRGTNSFCCGG